MTRCDIAISLAMNESWVKKEREKLTVIQARRSEATDPFFGKPFSQLGLQPDLLRSLGRQSHLFAK